MEENQIEVIETDAFVGCRDIWRIILAFNRITIIPDGLFRSNPTLQIFEANSNHITNIGVNVFAGTDVWAINLSNNRLSSFNPQIFETIGDTLTELFLAQNLITSIPERAFDRIRLLHDLDFSHNRVGDIPESAFSFLGNLENLELINCSISSISLQLFINLRSLKVLRLDNNNIRDIPERTFANIRELQTFGINGNSIRNIHASSFGNLSSLNYLLANSNGIRAIDREFFERSVGIRTMLLGDNRCTSTEFFNIQNNLELVREELNECFRMFDGFINCAYADGFYYICRLSIQNVQGLADFDEIGGTHVGNKTNADVILVDAESQDTVNIPPVICR